MQSANAICIRKCADKEHYKTRPKHTDFRMQFLFVVSDVKVTLSTVAVSELLVYWSLDGV